MDFSALSWPYPGYFRPEKKWDLVVVHGDTLAAAIEFKSQVGPSFGNNYNNRTEEAIGNAVDIWTAFREGRFGSARPWLGYLFLLEEAPKSTSPVRVREPFFEIDEVFRDASYKKRYEILCRRLLLERLYDAACFVTASADGTAPIHEPAQDLSFGNFRASYSRPCCRAARYWRRSRLRSALGIRPTSRRERARRDGRGSVW